MKEVKIAFFGTGLMGEPMARRLLSAGYNMMVYNRRIEKTLGLKNMGAQIAQNPAHALNFGNVIISMLADYPAFTDLFSRLPESSWQGKYLIQMSTISSKESRLLQNRLEKAGGYYLEAPVLGSIPQATAGTLIILAGGDEALFKQWDNLLAHLGDKRFFMGSVGQAAATKLAFNQLSISLLAAFSMSLGFLREKGVEVEPFMQILRQTAIYAPTFDRKLPMILARDFSQTNFPVRLLLKDTNLILEEFQQAHINTLPLEGVRRVIEITLEQGLEHMDYSAMYNTFHPA